MTGELPYGPRTLTHRAALALTGMAPRLVTRPAGRPRTVARPTDAVVIGGGPAGLAASTVLAERGVRVTLLEADDRLGGRVRSWPMTLPDGTPQVLEHGFHGYFRHYYTLRALLRRIDPGLSFLTRSDSYPVISRRWPTEDFGRLPRLPLLNLAALSARSPSLSLRGVRPADLMNLLPLLGFDPVTTYRDLDDTPAAELIASVGYPERTQVMLMRSFTRSFFDDDRELSAAEMIMMFHAYFLANPEGLPFDVLDGDPTTTLWNPLADRLGALGAEVRTGAPVRSVEPAPAGGWTVTGADGDRLTARHLVLATDLPAAQRLIGASPALAARAPALTERVAALPVAPPYTVARLWMDRDCAPERSPVSMVTGEEELDMLVLYHRFHEPSRAWARRTGGAVLELQALACSPATTAEETLRTLLAELAVLWPETAAMRPVHTELRKEARASGHRVGSNRDRPGVRTDARGLRLAGDWVRLPFPAGLMERAAASGVLAANDVLAEEDREPEPVWSVPVRSPLARWTRGGARRAH
ncbi:FAD-dependent oxidoreductase [Streptomyces sp. NPDC000594]|uniref:hydroxysqualene dehydroxylase n=1 Tax=Streptomyces sp. NPDC000594 TaxID=3154261 RepID=UPI00331C5F6C